MTDAWGRETTLPHRPPPGSPVSPRVTEAQARIALLAALTRLADAATRLIEETRE